MANRTIESGVYKITNLVNGKSYIGSTINLKDRSWQHFNALRKNKHCNAYLQRSFNKYGEENFKFEILEYCKNENLIEREQFYLDTYMACDSGYNICPNARSKLGLKQSIEQKTKIAESNRGKKRSTEFKKQCAIRQTGKKLSEETKRRMSEARKKYIMPEKHKRNISKGLTGIKLSPEHRKTLSESRYKYLEKINYIIPESTRLKLSISAKKDWASRKNKLAEEKNFEQSYH